VARALQQRGHGRLEALICSAPVPSCAPCARLLADTIGLTSLPIGAHRLGTLTRSPRFDEYDKHRRLAEDIYQAAGGLYNDILSRETYPDRQPETLDAVRLYRQVLVRAEANSIVICAIGTLSALEALLASPADDVSPLIGAELVRRQVRGLVTMAVGTYPAGRDGFNWAMDRIGSAAVLKHWPGEIMVSPAGEDVLTGGTLSTRLAPENPFRRAYELHRGGPHRSRSSWDQVAVLYAVGAHRQLFEEITGKGLTFDLETGSHQWHDAFVEYPRRHIQPKIPSPEMASIIEELMVEGATPP